MQVQGGIDKYSTSKMGVVMVVLPVTYRAATKVGERHEGGTAHVRWEKAKVKGGMSLRRKQNEGTYEKRARLILCTVEMALTLRGAVHDTCDVENRAFRGGAHLWCWPLAGEVWAIQVPSAG